MKYLYGGNYTTLAKEMGEEMKRWRHLCSRNARINIVKTCILRKVTFSEISVKSSTTFLSELAKINTQIHLKTQEATDRQSCLKKQS